MIPGVRRLLSALLAAATLAAAPAALAQTPASPDDAPTAPDLAPRALQPEELDPVTVARLALRYALDGVALDVLGRSGAPGLVLGVALEGQTVFLEAYGSAAVGGRAMPLDAPLWLASVTKPLTALAVLRLAADGRLDLDADVAALLPDGALGPPAAPGDRAITARDLLTHTAGLDVRLLGLTVPEGAPTPSARAVVADGLPARIAAPGSRLTYCNACYLALGALVEGVTGQDLDAAMRALVFDPLGFTQGSLAAEADPAYEAATVTPHVVAADGVTPVGMPRLREAGAGGARASARDMMTLAEALTAPVAPPPLADGVRDALLAPAVRVDPAMPGWTLGMAESAVLGHAVVRQDGDLPGVRASLLVVPQARLAVFAYLNATGGAADAFEAASGARDPRDVLLDAVVADLLGDARDPADPARGWPAPTVSSPGPVPAAGLYRIDRVPHEGPERMLAAVTPVFRVAVDPAATRVTITPPAALSAPLTYARDAAGTWRQDADGAPLVFAAGSDAIGAAGADAGAAGGPRLLVHQRTTVGLEPVAWLERPDVFLFSHAAALVAALAVLVSWPVGAFARWRRREPVAWAPARAVVRVRVWARAAAVLTLAALAGIGWLSWRAIATGDAPLAAAAPWLQATAGLLALAWLGHVAALAVGAVRLPGAAARWAWHALVAAAFSALLAQGWTWGIWSAAALARTWSALVG